MENNSAAKGDIMQAQAFKELDKVGARIYRKCEKVLMSPAMANVRRALRELEVTHPGYSVSLQCIFEVMDTNCTKVMPIFHMIMGSEEGGRCRTDCLDMSRQKYWVRGALCIVPHDRCPVCWHEWDSKCKEEPCPWCGAQFGTDVRLCLDTDTCPHCERGKITMKVPKCTDCGFEVVPGEVVWG